MKQVLAGALDVASLSEAVVMEASRRLGHSSWRFLLRWHCVLLEKSGLMVVYGMLHILF